MTNILESVVLQNFGKYQRELNINHNFKIYREPWTYLIWGHERSFFLPYETSSIINRDQTNEEPLLSNLVSGINKVKRMIIKY
jgi:hypothetical protein